MRLSQNFSFLGKAHMSDFIRLITAVGARLAGNRSVLWRMVVRLPVWLVYRLKLLGLKSVTFALESLDFTVLPKNCGLF
jgi:hypothetical protein